MPSSPEAYDGVAKALRRITAAWRAGAPDRMAPMLSEQIVMVAPGNARRLEGRDAFIESFAGFLHEAKVHEYESGSLEVDAGDRVAIAQYGYVMVYERAGARWRSTGTDLWVFEKRGTETHPSYMTVDAKLRYLMPVRNFNVDLFLDIYNLTNNQDAIYVTQATNDPLVRNNQQLFPYQSDRTLLAPRRYQAGVRLRF